MNNTDGQLWRSLRNYGWATMKRLEQLWSLVKFPKKALGGRRDSPKLRNEVDHLLNFATFLTFCSKIFSSVLLHSWFQEIWCQSLFEFDRLRPFLVIHRVFVTFFAAPEFVRVCSSLFEFVRVCSSSFYFLLSQNYSLAASAPPRISPQRLMDGTKPGLAPSFEVPVSLLFQTTNRHGSARSDGFLRTKPGLAPSFEVPVPLLFQTTNRHGSARSDGCLRTKPGLAPSFEVPVPLLFAAGAIRNSFQDVKDQLSSSGFDFGNPCERRIRILGSPFYSLLTRNYSLAVSARPSRIPLSPQTTTT